MKKANKNNKLIYYTNFISDTGTGNAIQESTVEFWVN